jgi:hypothetical protein
MAAKITRRRALEMAQLGLSALLVEAHKRLIAAQNATIGNSFDPDIQGEYEMADNSYAELAAALAMIEHMARQGEMHL